MFIHGLFTKEPVRMFGEFIVAKEGKILRSVVKMECMKPVNSGQCRPGAKTL